MTRLEDRLAELRRRGDGAFMPFLVAGDPNPDESIELCCALVEAGADVLELGFPFSDPPADGPVIQAADQRALAAGVHTERCFELLRTVHERCGCPMALLVYYNLVLQHGVDRFYADAKASGVDAILIADLPVEEAEVALQAARAHEIHPIFIVSRLTSDERLEKALAHASGYLYLVAHVGVTGARDQVASDLAETVEKVRKKSELPLFAGFGLSTPDQVRAALDAGADGAIVGSALVRHIEETDESQRRVELIREHAASLKRATEGALKAR